MTYAYLALAIIAEVIATSALKASEEFTNPLVSLIVVVGYGISFYFMTLVLRIFPIGITYAIWSGLGIVLVAIIGALFYKQSPDIPAMLGMGLIISGVIVIFIFSNTINH
jgi:small multidrug resistance pump